MYKKLHVLAKQLSKRDRFGIHAQIEEVLRACLTLSIRAALAAKQETAALLRSLQIELEVCKHVVRLAHELEVYTTKQYWDIEKQLRDLSQETARWYTYAKRSR